MSDEKQVLIGPSFPDELKAAGLFGLPFSWGADGHFTFDPALAAEKVTAIQAVYAAHDPTTPSWVAYQVQAQELLDKSDVTIARCTENSVAVPGAWATYRKALRAIVGATTGDATKALPTRPAYPAGT